MADRVAAGPDRDAIVSDEVRASWQRCATSGLIPDRIRARYEPDVDDASRLRWAAEPVMAAVNADLPDIPVALLLSDRRTHMVARWAPTSRTAMFMDSSGAAPGFICDELSIGTNSIGLAAHIRGPAVVHSYEHFADSLSHLTCAARAVTDPATGELLGVISMVSADPRHGATAPALVGRIVDETEARLFRESGARAMILNDAFLGARRRAKVPIVAIDAQTMFVNAAGSRLVAPADRPVLWDWARRVLRQGSTQHQLLVLPSGEWTARCTPILDGAGILGAILWFGSADEGRADVDAAGSWSTLTASERAVAEQVAAGLTNREIAANLYVSPHTVDYHLRHVFQKLRVSSRVDVARLAQFE
ncbi:MAG TPA: LuxR C-terminal-related transcriptional regulator [Jatrophihabitans sp.]